MQSSKIEFIKKYNDLIKFALSSSKEFPDSLCEFLVNEYEIEATVLASIKEKDFEILGKSSDARKILEPISTEQCSGCTKFQAESSETIFVLDPECQFKATDQVMVEGCLHISISDSEKVIFKIAKKNDFTQLEKDNLLIVGESVRNLLKICEPGIAPRQVGSN